MGKQIKLVMGRAYYLITIALISILLLSIQATFAQSNIITITPTQITDYIANPGMGWQNVLGNTPFLLPETVAYGTREDMMANS